jgi:hypothetical protein
LFTKYEDTLKILAKKLSCGDNYIIKTNANKKFIETLSRALSEKNSFDYSFDSLITIARLVSPDKSFKIYNWVLLTDEGVYKYYGLLQIHNMKDNTNKIILLKDKSDSISNFENSFLSSDKWYGALYYKIIYTKYKNNKYYTLLGWQGNNLLSRKKVIDVLTFSSSGEPVFGADIFKTDKAEQKRIIFEYSSEAVMSLKYEQQYYDKSKLKDQKPKLKDLKNRNKSKVRKKKAYMIVFDHLVPLASGLEGVAQFYVPTIDYVDAFIFISGKWRLIRDIEANNPPSNNVKDVRRKAPVNIKQNDFRKR